VKEVMATTMPDEANARVQELTRPSDRHRGAAAVSGTDVAERVRAPGRVCEFLDSMGSAREPRSQRGLVAMVSSTPGQDRTPS
jgi:hypothetical protein